jgi:DNA-binding transcriptional LysR family regulator
MVLDEVAEIGIATESLSDYPDLVTLPCYEWQHVLVLPQDHPLAKKERITLEDLAAEPLITYHPSFTGRTAHRPAFRRASCSRASRWRPSTPTSSRPTCASGLGIGIVAEMAVRDDGTNSDLSCGRWARCSASTWRASPSSAAPTCATSSINSPNCSATAGPQPDRQGHGRPRQRLRALIPTHEP